MSINREVETIASLIQKDFGDNSITILGKKVEIDVPAVSTGSLVLDRALGCGGLPYGRIVEIFGPESSGKTTICLHVLASVQKSGGICAFIDTEHSLDPEYAGKIGVDTDNLLLSQPNAGEEALNICEKLVNSKKVKCIVVDSVAALTPRAELEGEMGESHMGLHARLMSQACRKLTAPIEKNGVIVIFTNQIRSKIGVVYGSPEVTTGGNALKFYSSIRMDVRKRVIEFNKKKEPIGHNVAIKIVKNKCATPFKVAETFIEYGVGFNPLDEVFSLCESQKIIERRGAHYFIGDLKIGVGKDKAKEYIKSQDGMIDSLKSQLFGKPEEVQIEKPKKTRTRRSTKKAPASKTEAEVVAEKSSKTSEEKPKSKRAPRNTTKRTRKKSTEPVVDLKAMVAELKSMKSEINAMERSDPKRKKLVTTYKAKVTEYKRVKDSGSATSS